VPARQHDAQTTAKTDPSGSAANSTHAINTDDTSSDIVTAGPGHTSGTAGKHPTVPSPRTRVEDGATRCMGVRVEVRAVEGAKSRVVSRMFSGFRSVCVSLISCMKATEVTSWSANAWTQYRGMGRYLFVFR
jgi:hypothetical protein